MKREGALSLYTSIGEVGFIELTGGTVQRTEVAPSLKYYVSGLQCEPELLRPSQAVPSNGRVRRRLTDKIQQCMRIPLLNQAT